MTGGQLVIGGTGRRMHGLCVAIKRLSCLLIGGDGAMLQHKLILTVRRPLAAALSVDIRSEEDQQA